MKYTKVSETSTCRLRAVLSQPATSDLRPLEAAVVDPSSTRAIKGVLHNSPLLGGEGMGLRSLSEHLTSGIQSLEAAPLPAGYRSRCAQAGTPLDESLYDPQRGGRLAGTLRLRSRSSGTTSSFSSARGFSLTELMIVLVIIGVLVLLALPKLTPVVTKAKSTEAKLQLKQLYSLEQTYKFEQDRYSTNLADVGFEQAKIVSDGGQARYNIEVISADERSFVGQATAVVDFDNDGTFNVWTVDESGVVKEKIPD